MDSEIWSTLSYGFITYMNPGTHLSDEPILFCSVFAILSFSGSFVFLKPLAAFLYEQVPICRMS